MLNKFNVDYFKILLNQNINLINIIGNGSWLFLDKILRLGIGLLVGVVVTRYLGPERYGLLSFVIAYIGLFSSFATLGLQNIVVRDLVIETKKATHETIGTTAILLFLSGLFSYLISLGIILFLRPNDVIVFPLVMIFGLILLLKFSEVSVFWFESKVKSKYVVWTQVSNFILFSLIKIILVKNTASLDAFVWLSVLEFFLGAIVLFVIMGKSGILLTSLRFNKSRAQTLLKDSWPLIISTIASTINMKIDQVMLGQIIGVRAVGIFSVAVKISEVWYFAIGIVLTSVFPSLIKMYTNNDFRIHKSWVKIIRILIFSSILCALCLTLFAESIVIFLYGNEYKESSTVLMIHAWAGINVAIGSIWSYWILLEGKLKLGLYAQIISALLNILLNILLIPRYGVNGSAFATLISYFLSATISYTFYKPHLFFGYIKKAVLLLN
jgi:O-antigen/teichoic acid export membrane protein